MSTDDEPKIISLEAAEEISDKEYPVPPDVLEYEHENGLDVDQES